MANTFVVSRPQIIYGLCLPLAVLVGYFLAEPLDSGSVAVVVLIISVLSVPLLMRWHHPLLIVSWNATIDPYFLPGRPYLWMLMAVLSLFFGLLNRATNPNKRFLYVPSLTKPLLFLAAVVVATALTTGGVGVRALGSASFGGKGYFYIMAAIAGYFAFTSQPIPPNRAGTYVALFFLSGLTSVISNLTYLAGPKFYFLYDLFPPEFAMDQAASDFSITKEYGRISGLAWTSQAAWCCILARYGIEGVFDLTRPWRLVLFLSAVVVGMFGGFRSTTILFGLAFVILFWIEKLWRTRILLIVSLAAILAGASLVLLVDKLPLQVQRAVSFLPIKVDPIIRQSAEGSNEWRLEMWKALIPDVPKYLLKGKGYAINSQDLYLVTELAARGLVSSTEAAKLAGNYHNGPLSLLIPFGIYGAIGFIWVVIASLRVLHRNYQYGEPELRRINALLLALFFSRAIFFLFIFGAIHDELFYFTGLIGLSVALNRGIRASNQSMAEPAAVRMNYP